MRIRSDIFLLCATLSVACLWSAHAASLTYTLGMPHPATHLFTVRIEVRALTAADSVLDFVLPAWRSGRYVIFDFAGGVEDFSATSAGGTPLPWGKTDKNTWRVRTAGNGTCVVSYLVFSDQLNLRTRFLDDERGFVDGTAVFMYVQQERSSPLTLSVRPPAGWHVTTSLDTLPGVPNHYAVADYDLLADSPLEIGTQRDYPFEVRGVPHVLSLSGRLNCDPDSMIAWITKIVEINAEYWGGLPYRRYVFLLRALPGGGGGTEHLNSCVLDVRESPFRRLTSGREYMGLVSHEFFHTWNVKRLRPRGMNPYDWTKENYYRELWLAEGGTSYMDNLLLVRNGLRPVDSYLWSVAHEVESDRQRPGNKEQSVAECSFDAWIKFNRPSDDAYNFQTDFYARGSAICLLMDLELRFRSEGRASFDDLLRLLYRRFPLGTRGYTLDDVEAAAVELGGEAMHDFFTRYVRGVAPLPWESTLSHAGLALVPRSDSQSPWLGIGVRNEGAATVVQGVVAGSPAYRAGLDVGDQLLALDGVKITSDGLPARIADRNPGDTVRIAYFHYDELRESDVVLIPDPVPSYDLRPVKDPTALQRRIFAGWLGQPWKE
jgi:predicted metalloprotease with PDZ domain